MPEKELLESNCRLSMKYAPAPEGKVEVTASCFRRGQMGFCAAERGAGEEERTAPAHDRAAELGHVWSDYEFSNNVCTAPATRPGVPIRVVRSGVYRWASLRGVSIPVRGAPGASHHRVRIPGRPLPRAPSRPLPDCSLILKFPTENKTDD